MTASTNYWPWRFATVAGREAREQADTLYKDSGGTATPEQVLEMLREYERHMAHADRIMHHLHYELWRARKRKSARKVYKRNNRIDTERFGATKLVLHGFGFDGLEPESFPGERFYPDGE